MRQPDIPQVDVGSIEWDLLQAIGAVVTDIQRLKACSEEDIPGIANLLNAHVKQTRDLLNTTAAEVREIRNKQRTSTSTEVGRADPEV